MKQTVCKAVIALAAALPLHTSNGAEELRTYFIGNSLTDELRYESFDKLCDAAGTPINWGRHMIPGAPISWLWDHQEGFTSKHGASIKALKENDWDIVTLQPFSTFESELTAAEKYARTIAERRPDTQLLIYAQWPGRRGRDWFSAFSGGQSSGNLEETRQKYPGNAFPDIMEAASKDGYIAQGNGSLKERYEGVVLGLRQKQILTTPVRLIPAGHTMELLGQKMAAGLVPGYKEVWDLYSDGVHVNNVASYLVACSFWSTIFKKSPVGLPVTGYEPIPDAPDDHYPISPELAKVIQETVWETVASHPLTGVTSREPLKIASPGLLRATANEPYNMVVRAAFGAPPYEWSAAKPLPAGLAISRYGTLSGTAGAEGAVAVSLLVKDSAGKTLSQDLKLTIDPDTAPKIVTDSIPSMGLGEFVSIPLQAEGGNGTMLWKVAAGALPGGLLIENDRITGSPGEEGSFTFTLECTDADTITPDSAKKEFTVQVGPAKGTVVVAPWTADKVKVDGVFSEGEWDFSHVAEKSARGSSDNKVQFAVAFDKSRIYVAVRVRDNQVLPTDTIEVYFDGKNNREATYNFDDRRFTYRADGNMDPAKSIRGTAYMNSGKAVKLEDGYGLEFSIDFKNLDRTGAGSKSVIGVDVMNVDFDGVDEAGVIVWAGSADNAQDPSKFGSVVLGESPAPAKGSGKK